MTETERLRESIKQLESAESRAALAEKVLCIVDRFIVEQRITCVETIYQTDRVSENACEFIDRICAVAGFAEEAP